MHALQLNTAVRCSNPHDADGEFIQLQEIQEIQNVDERGIFLFSIGYLIWILFCKTTDIIFYLLDLEEKKQLTKKLLAAC